MINLAAHCRVFVCTQTLFTFIVLMSILYLYKYSAIEVFLIILGIAVITDVLIAVILRKMRKWQWILLTHACIAVAVYALLVWAFFINHWEHRIETFSVFFILTNHLTLFYLTKIVFLLFAWLFLLIRREFIVKMASTLALIAFIALLFGLYVGRFNFVIKENVITTEKNLVLPLKIAFISDLHLGQYYGHEKRFGQLIELVNSQNPDLILLGGDMICCIAEEMRPFVPYLKQLKAKYGIYAVHGNHDYGDYFWWKDSNAKQWNHQMLEYYYQLANIRLLNNEWVKLPDHAITVAGLENCGRPPYGCYADWKKALDSISSDQYIILVTHDPWNWDRVVEHYSQVKLTLSGHTHAYQIGIDNGNICWSPFFPKEPWCGMYSRKDQHLYISRGVGSAMHSFRLGMWPEITIITLR